MRSFAQQEPLVQGVVHELEQEARVEQEQGSFRGGRMQGRLSGVLRQDRPEAELLQQQDGHQRQANNRAVPHDMQGLRAKRSQASANSSATTKSTTTAAAAAK